MFFALVAVILAVAAGILGSLLRTEHRENIIDMNKKVILRGGKNMNPTASANGNGIIEENLSREHTVIKNRKSRIEVPVLCLIEQNRHIVYRGQFVEGQILIGRIEDPARHPREGMLCMKDAKVSHIHCRIYQEQKGYLVEDCQSTNHTWVNGKPVTSAVPLRDGDKLRLAKKTYEVRFSMEYA